MNDRWDGNLHQSGSCRGDGHRNRPVDRHWPCRSACTKYRTSTEDLPGSAKADLARDRSPDTEDPGLSCSMHQNGCSSPYPAALGGSSCKEDVSCNTKLSSNMR